MKIVSPTGRKIPGGIRRTVGELAAAASIEVVPRQIQAQPLASLLPPGTRVYVPFLPRAAFDETVAACRRLLAAGMQPVPHLPARALVSRSQLADVLSSFSDLGMGQLLLIAGDRASPAGPYPDTLAVLESGLLAEHGIRRIGVAGHPEGHPRASDSDTLGALRAKMDYARATGSRLWLVSQFVFSSEPLIAWLRRLEALEIRLPVHVGMPGPTSIGTLMAFAAQCGVDASTRILLRRPGTARLLGRWTPDGLVHDLARHRCENPDTLLRGLHLFTFGGAVQCARWLTELRAGADQEVAAPTARPDCRGAGS